MVTVIDAKNFENDYMSLDKISDRESDEEADDRNIVDLLSEQIEFANVIIINKTDLVSEFKKEEIKSLIKKLNPVAKIIETTHGMVDPNEILNTRLFDFMEASQSAGWIKELENEHTPETDEYGIGSFVYRSRKPFHLARFEDYINNEWDQGILRSKGFIWTASQPNDALLWNQAGMVSSIQNSGLWWASLPTIERNQNPTFQAHEDIIMSKWDKQFGDRLIELVIIGQDMPQKKITRDLDKCLCTEEELELVDL